MYLIDSIQFWYIFTERSAHWMAFDWRQSDTLFLRQLRVVTNSHKLFDFCSWFRLNYWANNSSIDWVCRVQWRQLAIAPSLHRNTHTQLIIHTKRFFHGKSFISDKSCWNSWHILHSVVDQTRIRLLFALHTNHFVIHHKHIHMRNHFPSFPFIGMNWTQMSK